MGLDYRVSESVRELAGPLGDRLPAVAQPRESVSGCVEGEKVKAMLDSFRVTTPDLFGQRISGVLQ